MNLKILKDKLIEKLAVVFNEPIEIKENLNAGSDSFLSVNGHIVRIGKTHNKLRQFPGVTISQDEVDCYLLDDGRFYLTDRDVVDKIAHMSLQKKLDKIHEQNPSC